MESLLAAIIGALVASAGWFVTYRQQQKTKTREEHLVFLRRQVEEFYAPLLGLVQRKIAVQDVQDQRLQGGWEKLGETWYPILTYFMDTQTVPLMEQIAELLETKGYLATDWPDSFDKYLLHEAKSVALYKLWRNTGHKGGIDTEPWPTAFEQDIRKRKEELENELRGLIAGKAGNSKRIVSVIVT